MRRLLLCLSGACVLAGAAAWSWSLAGHGHHARLGFRIGDRGEIDLASIKLLTTAVGPASGPWTGPSRRVGPTQVEMARGSATEVVQGLTASASIEQRWRFDQAPAGGGPLTIRVAVERAQLHRIHDGVRLSSAGGPATFRYSDGTWIDAAGRRTPIAARVEGQEIALTVPADLVARSRYPAVLDPTITPELPLDMLVGAPLGDTFAREPASAAGNGQSLVVWSDERRGWAQHTAVHAARIDATGAVLDDLSFPLAAVPALDQFEPAVAFDGTNWLVVWSQGTFSAGFHVVGVRVSGAGAVLDAAPRNLSGTTSTQGAPAVAFDGTNYLVVFHDSRATVDVYGLRVSPGLAPVGAPFAISSAASGQSDPAVAFGGGRYLVAWSDGRNGSNSDIYAARVETDGTVTDPGGIAVATLPDNQGGVAVASNGTDYLVSYRSERSGFNPSLLVARVAADGTVLDPAGLLVDDSVYYNSFITRAAFDGTRYLVAWEDNDGYALMAAWLNADGTLDGSPFRVAGDPSTFTRANGAAVSARGAEVLVAWTDPRAGANVCATRVTRAGGILDGAGVIVSRAGNRQTSVSLAAGPGGYLAVWSDDRGDGDPGIYAVRLTADGTPIDATPFVVSDTPAASEQHPAVTFDGTQYVVAWSAVSDPGGFGIDREIRAARVSTSGVVLDPAPIFIAPGTLYPDPPNVASAGGVTLVAFTTYDTFTRARYVRLAGDGTVLDPSPVDLPRPPNTAMQAVRVASDGTGWLVVLMSRSFSPDLYHLHGVRLTPAGVLADATPFEITSGFSYADPSVAFGGGAYLVAWTNDYDFFYGFGDIWAKRVFTDAGVPLSTAIVAFQAGIEDQSRVAFDGMNWVVTWRGTSDGGGIFAARVNPSGVVLDPGSGFSVTASSDYELDPAIASAAPGRSLVGYSRQITTSPALGMRSRARGIDDVLPQACTDAGTCASGFCADGVCCDTACGGGDPTDCLACSTAAGARVNGICGPAAYGTVCRPAAHACDAEEVCQGGTSTTCPPDVMATGRTCDDSARCTTNDRCQSDGGCEGSPVVCSAANNCYDAGTCDPNTGLCSQPQRPDGSSCDDFNLCTQTSACQAGTCQGSNPVACQPPSNQCRRIAGACQPFTGLCPEGNRPNFSSCDDGNLCTTFDYCFSGACYSGTPVTCSAQDECHAAGACQPTNGLCTNPTRPDGAPCDGGTCQSGACAAPDAGTPDAGESDAGSSDAGATDAGNTPDAGAPDAGSPPDAGAPDAGDAQDGGMTADGGVNPPPPGGCGCAAGGEGVLLQVAAIVLAAALRRRRRSIG